MTMTLFFGGCSKDDNPAVPTEGTKTTGVIGGEKSNTQYVFRFVNGAAPYEFAVQQNGYCIGKVKRSQQVLDPTFPGQQLVGSGYVWTAGYCPTSTTECRFDKGAGPSIWGPWYVVVPNQGATYATRSVLMFRMKGTQMYGISASGTHRYFTYDVSSNLWSLGTEAVNAEFDGILEHQTVVGVPDCILLENRK